MKKNNFKLPLKENEILFENNHKIVEAESDVIEMKYCPHCKEWHVLTDFSISSRSKDGLQSWCRECQKQYGRERVATRKMGTGKSEVDRISDEQEMIEERDFFAKGMDIISKMQVKAKAQKQEIIQLKEQIKTLKDKSISLDSLSEREIEIVLKSNKIAPRLLFEAISRQDDRYTFFARDSVSGQTYPIKIERVVA